MDSRRKRKGTKREEPSSPQQEQRPKKRQRILRSTKNDNDDTKDTEDERTDDSNTQISARESRVQLREANRTIQQLQDRISSLQKAVDSLQKYITEQLIDAQTKHPPQHQTEEQKNTSQEKTISLEKKQDIVTLPNDIMLLIFQFLEPVDLLSIQQLSTYWNKEIWKYQIHLKLNSSKHLLNANLVNLILSKCSTYQKLRTLSCHLNDVTKLDLSLLTSLTTLQRLDLINVFSDSLVSYLSNLSQLTNFRSNYFLDENFWKFCQHWTNLRKLSTFVSSINCLPSLHALECLTIKFQSRFDADLVHQQFLSVLSSLTNLRELYYDSIFHISSVVTTLHSLSLLTRLVLGCCDHDEIHTISRSLHRKLSPLTSLCFLSLGECHVRRTDDNNLLHLFSNVQRLILTCNEPLTRYNDELDTDYFESFLSLKRLTGLDVNVSSEMSVPWLSCLTQLQHLALHYHENAEHTPTYNFLTNLSNLTSFYCGLALKNEELQRLSILTKLHFLRLPNSEAMSLQTLKSLSTLTNLKDYEFDFQSEIQDEDTNVLKSFGQLTILRMMNARHIGACAQFAISTLQRLRRVEFYRCKVQVPTLFFDVLVTLPQLSGLILHNVKGFEFVHLYNLSKLTSLSNLTLESMSTVDNNVIQNVAKLTQLRSLELIHCDNFNQDCFNFFTSLKELRKFTLDCDNPSFCVDLLCESIRKLSKLMFLAIPFPKTAKRKSLSPLRNSLPFLQELSLLCPSVLSKDWLRETTDFLGLKSTFVNSILSKTQAQKRETFEHCNIM